MASYQMEDILRIQNIVKRGEGTHQITQRGRPLGVLIFDGVIP